ncbi:hypothetical protein BCD67_20710 [Oscillatoriales cyanobacterium USR001]|nr:hypothetical protein BCD67_20710 [Oscillatoriales cyanobacterium USR001]
MKIPPDYPSPSPPIDDDSNFQSEVQRLHELTVYGRWLFVAFLWVTVAPLSLWGLRDELVLWVENFTWAAVRYGLIYHRLSAIGLGLCIGMTLAVLIWQSRNILLGLPRKERQRLEQQVRRIRQQGQSHPLWRLVCRE